MKQGKQKKKRIKDGKNVNVTRSGRWKGNDHMNIVIDISKYLNFVFDSVRILSAVEFRVVK
jgi:hypothetical protein